MPDRAVVAISVDRQWLVVLVGEAWVFFRRGLGTARNYYESHTMPDAGQDAYEVLDAFLQEREA